MSAKRMLAWGRWLWGFWSASWQENPLVPNKPHQLRIRVYHHVSFHLLYRGTWFPTHGKEDDDADHHAVSIRYIAVLGFQPWLRRKMEHQTSKSFHPLYRGTWFPTVVEAKDGTPNIKKFPSAISRYLVSNSANKTTRRLLRRFHPLYRGTWFPTHGKEDDDADHHAVSIRYIAVLGFQRHVHIPSREGVPLVSIRYIAVLGFQQENFERHNHYCCWVSIRYIAVLGFQQENFERHNHYCCWVSIRYIAVLGFQRG